MTEETSETIQQGAGAFLKEQRERLGLTVADVATKLKMVEQYILNIEADNYVDIPMTFYKGYLKNYAHLLELDDNAVMEKFSQFAQEQGLESQAKTPYKRISMDIKAEKQYGSFLGKFFGFVVLGLVAFSVYFVLFEKGYWDKFMQTFERTSESSLSIDGSEGALNTDNSLELRLTNDNELALNPDFSESGNASGAGGALNVNVSNENPISEAPSGNSSDMNATLEPIAAVSPAKTSTSVANAPVENGAVLKVVYKGKSWVKITDATGEVLSIGIKKSGHVSELNGQAPYQLTIGDTSAVDVFYQGQSVDLSPYANGKMAKLTLGSGN